VRGKEAYKKNEEKNSLEIILLKKGGKTTHTETQRRPKIT
jgi:hypothetical protein